MKFLVVSGPSGGHIFPAAAFIDRLVSLRPEDQVLFVLPRRNALPPGQVKKYRTAFLPIASIRRSIDPENLGRIFGFLKGVASSLLIVAGWRPQVVVGFGSIVSVPVVFFAWLFRIPVVIHEQNVLPGKANRLLAWFASCVAVSFEETPSYLGPDAHKAVFTGNPVRSGLEKIGRDQALDFFSLGRSPDRDRLTVLVMGGSQGSQSINEAWLRALSGFSDRTGLQVIHLAGPGDRPYLEQIYKGLGVRAAVRAFLPEMHYAYGACDLAICRAGATTLAELVYFGVPALLVPYPYAGAHQAANAGFLKRTGGAVVITEEELRAGALSGFLESMAGEPQLLERMRSSFAGMAKPDNGELLVAAARRAAGEK